MKNMIFSILVTLIVSAGAYAYNNDQVKDHEKKAREHSENADKARREGKNMKSIKESSKANKENWKAVEKMMNNK